MPIYMTKRVERNAVVGIWKVVESEQYFLNHMRLDASEIALLRSIKGVGKRIQWMASRWLLHLMSERSLRSACLKDAFGKPYLKDSDHLISLSHSGDMVAVAAGLMPIGVDIQRIVPKIHRIKDKFCNSTDLEAADQVDQLRLLHAIWGAKEAMFKAYGRKQVDFRENMTVSIQHMGRESLHGTGFFKKPHYEATFDLYMENVQDFMFVYALQHE